MDSKLMTLIIVVTIVALLCILAERVANRNAKITIDLLDDRYAKILLQYNENASSNKMMMFKIANAKASYISIDFTILQIALLDRSTRRCITQLINT